MKILNSDFRKGKAKILTQDMDDLWYLSQIIEASDFVRAKTERKIKIGSSENQKVTKKIFIVTIQTQKTELTEESLRISGIITDGPDDIPRGVYQTISIDTKTQLSIQKQEWLKYQQQKLQEAANQTPLKIIAVIFDREDALFYNIKNNGHELITTIKGNVQKKDMQQNKTQNFYKEIVKLIEEFDKQHAPQSIVIASPSFWKEYLLKEIPLELKKKIISASCSEVSPRAITELLKRPELQKTLDRSKSVGEEAIIAELLEAVSKDNATYGVQNVQQCINDANIKNIILTTDFIHEQREANTFKQIEQLMKKAEQCNAKVHIIATKEAGQKLNALTGFAAIKRW